MAIQSGDLKTALDFVGSTITPVLLFVFGNLVLKQKERNERALRDAAQLTQFIEHLAGDNKERKKLALLALYHLKGANLFPDSLLKVVQSIVSSDDLELSAMASIALGTLRPIEGISAKEESLLFEILLPVKIHFERTKHAFSRWISMPLASPNTQIEEIIKSSNTAVRNLLTTKWHLLPEDLQPDAADLIQHYDAWLEEFERVRPGGIRAPEPKFVFVGPKGVPFPSEAEQHFLNRLNKLTITTGN